jgi:hypothetical protein
MRKRYQLLFAALLFMPLPVLAQSRSLSVVVFGQHTLLSSAEIAVLPRDSVKARIHDGSERWYAGPSLLSVLRRAGARVDTVRGPALRQVVIADASDGYRVVFSLAELAAGIGNRLVLLIDRIDGKPIPDEEGPWRLLVPADDHPTRWARQVVAIRLEDLRP